MMNKLLLFLSFVFLFSCERKPPYHYVIKNESGVDIVFIPYENDQPIVAKKVMLKNNRFIDKRFIASAGHERLTMDEVLFDHYNEATHIEIVFNNQKKVLYEGCHIDFQNCLNNPRSIFYYKFNDDYNSIYTVTAEDYQNAVDCNGNCY
ncbi:hypothetical protein [Bergeyella zoohelcum]|nr:hypothetical protein [Bergeyella zoohelcum]